MAQEQATAPPPPGRLRAGLTDTAENIEGQLRDTGQQAADAWAEVRHTVGNAAHDTATSLRGAFSVTGLVRRHPWVVWAGCALAGVLLLRLLAPRQGR